MPRRVGDTIPPEVEAAFDGDGLERKLGLAYLLLTSDEDGTPRPCMVSAGEVLATGERELRFALWEGSRTCENLARGGTALFLYVAPRSVLYLRGRTRQLEGPAPPRILLFELAVDSVESDTHDGMPVTSGIGYMVVRPSPTEVLAGWRRQLVALRLA